MGSFLRSIYLLTRLTCKETLRSKTYGFVVLFSLVSTSSAYLFLNFTFQEQEKFFKDISFASITFFCFVLVTLLGATQIHDDFENCSIYTLVMNPMSPMGYLLGRFLGIVFLSGLALFLMGILFYLNLIVQNIRFTMLDLPLDASLHSLLPHLIKKTFLDNISILKAFVATFFQGLILSSVALFLSVFFTSVHAIVATVFFFMVGHLMDFLIQTAYQYHAFLGNLFRGLLIGIPNLENFNISDAIVLGQNISGTYIVYLFLYTTVSVAIFLTLAHQKILSRMTNLVG